MARKVMPRLGWTVLAISAAFIPAWSLPGKQKAQGTAPVPRQITTASRVFISNAGRGCSPFGDPYFSGGSNRSYNQFYAAMKSWGRYELANSPSAAELNFKFGLSCPPVTTTNSLKEVNAGTTYDPQLRLVILDMKTHTVLWTITVHVKRAILQHNRDKNFDEAMASLVSDLEQLATKAAQSAPSHSHSGP